MALEPQLLRHCITMPGPPEDPSHVYRNQHSNRVLQVALPLCGWAVFTTGFTISTSNVALLCFVCLATLGAPGLASSCLGTAAPPNQGGAVHLGGCTSTGAVPWAGSHAGAGVGRWRVGLAWHTYRGPFAPPVPAARKRRFSRPGCSMHGQGH